MLVLIPMFWVLSVFGQIGAFDHGPKAAQSRDSSSSITMTGKPIKIPPKKV